MNQFTPAWMINSPKETIDEFHKLFYSRGEIAGDHNGIIMPVEASYLGIHVQKNPLDLWIYQEILNDKKPDLIIECGTAAGGTTLFLAHILDQLFPDEQNEVKHGFRDSALFQISQSVQHKILSIDIADRLNIVPQHQRIDYWVVDSLDRTYLNILKGIVEVSNRVMVILDDDHSEEHVYQELQLYSQFVDVGQYLIVEDTNINGHPVGVKRAPGGPQEAVTRFLSETSDFVVDRTKEKFLMTFNPGGYLKRVK